jgi:hypothetical protein
MEIVNGYPCKNCTDVENAKKGIDPAKPKDGPNGVNSPEAKLKAEEAKKAAKGAEGPAERGPAVTFSGALANVTQPDEAQKTQPYKPGQGFSLTA